MPASYAQIVQACSKWNKFSLSFCCMQNYCTLTLTEKPNFPPQGVPESFKVWIEPAWVLTMSCLSGKVCWLRNMAKSKKENEAVGGGCSYTENRNFKSASVDAAASWVTKRGKKAGCPNLLPLPLSAPFFFFFFFFPATQYQERRRRKGTNT